MMKSFNQLFTVSFLSLAMLFSCGGEKEKSAAEKESTQGPTSAELMQEAAKNKESNADKEETKAEKNIVEIVIEASDQMKFNKNKIKVPAGSTVKLTLKHVGKMSKEAMGHNWVLLKTGTDPMEFGRAAVSAAGNDYIPQGNDEVIVHTELLGGGETDSIEFEAPEAGTYDFICSFPGHVALMKGKFIVE